MSNRAPFEIKRHYRQVSKKDADAVVQIVAELIVTYLKTSCGSTSATARGTGSRSLAQSVRGHPRLRLDLRPD